jgi:CRISPR-associated protein Csy2
MKLLLIKHLKILNANAVSSSYTIGFPAMTAWLGAMHALQRHLNAAGYVDLKFKSIGIACHELDLQTVQQGFNHSIIGSRNPLKSDGKLPSTIPEARCHLDVSLVIEYEGKGIASDLERNTFTEKTYQLIMSKMKIAGGTVHSLDQKILLQSVEPEDEKKFLAKLMPSWIIVERRNLVKNAMKDGKDALDAILEHLKVTSGQPRKEKGWIVPIAAGFYGISKPAFAKNQRDPSVEVEHCFAESIVTLGEFKMPRRIKNVNEMLWCYHKTSANDLYICTTKQENEHV